MSDTMRAVSTPSSPGRVPPQSLEAEMAVLGAVLLDNNAFSIATESLTWNCFYKKANQDIFAAMEGLSGRGEAIDVVTLSEELKQRGHYQSVGGALYLTEIMDGVHTAANVEYYSGIVLEKFVMREVITICNEVSSQSYTAERDASDLLDEAERRLFELSQRGLFKGFLHIGPLITERIKHIESLAEGKGIISGLPSWLTDLDEKTGGFQKSDLIILAGRPSMGKTAFALNLCEFLAIQKKIPVGIFSLEMTAEALVTRLLCSQGRVSAHKLRSGYISQNELSSLVIAAGHLGASPIYIDDSASVSTLELRAKARRLKAQYQIEILVIDYLQLLGVRARTENRQQEISAISRSLKALAKELNIPVIALSQLSRAVETRSDKDKRPMLSDLRESGSLEQDADLVMFLYRGEVYHRDDDDLKGKAELIIAKQRNGPIGTVPLTFVHEHTLFLPGMDEPAAFGD